MKKTIAALIGILLAAGLTRANIVFLETFPNPDEDSPLTNINWNASVSINGTVYTGGTGLEGPILSSQDYIYISGGSAAVVGKPWLAWTDAVAIGPFSSIDYIIMDLKNSRTTENLKIALKVNGSWYVSQDVFNSPDDSAFVTVGLLYVQGAKWNELDFTAGSTLVEGGSAGAPSGTVQAIGVFDASALSIARIDNLTVKSTIIIPSGTTITIN
jgi:hypothetical protein